VLTNGLPQPPARADLNCRGVHVGGPATPSQLPIYFPLHWFASVSQLRPKSPACSLNATSRRARCLALPGPECQMTCT
jgi:hypothetical protein